MASLFKKPSELKTTPAIKVLVYGQPGIGKSSFALSAPNPVLLDFDGGIQRVNGAFQCPTLQVENWEQVNMALAEDLSEFKTIVIDTVGKMLDYMSEYIIRTDPTKAMRDGSLSLKGYGVRKQMFINFVSKCSIMGKNLVFVAHEREDKDGETKVVRPEIGGSSAGDLIKELDLVGYMQAIGNDRTVFWTPNEKFYAKNTCNLPSFIKIPTIIDNNGDITGSNNMMTRIFDSYQKYLDAQHTKSMDYDAIIEVIKAKIDSVVDVETANAVKDEIPNLAVIWDSKTKAGIWLNNKCNSLGLSYNRTSGKYEPNTIG